MKLPKVNPKQLFRSKKSSHVSRSDPSSFSSGAASSSSSDSSSSTHLKQVPNAVESPTSVLTSLEISEESSDIISSGVCDELEEAFKLIDRDGDGKIPWSELETLLSQVAGKPLSEDELLTMLTELDHDGDGCISLDEFRTISPAFGPACGSELRDAFDIFDTDHDGKITAEELLRVFTAIGDERCTLEDCRRMIDGVDKTGDGFVCFEDFTRMMGQQS
ncbi:hypothetical protein L1049_009078 [Liquidambar formosana]|uniref:EF-hand domain-containing protein n=1 Tax=Liquidambar formosana TaxID=63359 RepID=A0AAP0SBP3_LIQFO